MTYGGSDFCQHTASQPNFCTQEVTPGRSEQGGRWADNHKVQPKTVT